METRESLLAELEKVDSEMAALEKGGKAGKKVTVSRGKSKTGKGGSRIARGALTAAILDMLEKAGKGGISVKDIAKAIGVKAGSVNVWFSRSGKKLSRIYKVKPGLYGLKAMK